MFNSIFSDVVKRFFFSYLLVTSLSFGLIAEVSAKPKGVRTIDGSENNKKNPEQGKANTQLLRLTTVDYGDQISTPSGSNRPSPREISNQLCNQEQSIPNDRNLTGLVWLWGQFLDHDIDLTTHADPIEEFPIPVPTGDIFFDPGSTGIQVIPLERSIFDTSTGTSTESPRQQLNTITSYIDGSNVYGSDDVRAAALRTFEGGKLKTSDDNLLPKNTEGLPNAGGPSPSLFLAGDIRANENIILTSMHTVFMREHNRLAEEIAAAKPKLNDEEIYQRARKQVIGLMQGITYNEFLPALFGDKPLKKYKGYKKKIDASIANVFSTAAYRFGHSTVNSVVMRLDNDGNVIPEGNLELADAFFRPDQIQDSDDIDFLLKGISSILMEEVDIFVVGDLRNFLFGPPGAGGLDLPSLNMQRGRDHGLPGYNEVRRNYGLAAATSFTDINSNTEIANKISEAYGGDIEKVDAWLGIIAEDHITGTSTGETMRTIVLDQFNRLRKGDRFWYENYLSKKKIKEVNNTTLADVIKRNTGLTTLQENVFFLNTNP